MRQVLGIIGAVALILGLAGGAGAGLVNFGFETGDLTGWDYNSLPLTSVVTTAQTYNGTSYGAYEGAYFAVLTAGLGWETVTIIGQGMTLNAGNTLSGKALFDGRDAMPYNDYAYVSVVQGHFPHDIWTQVWFCDIPLVGDYGHTGWQTWSFTAPAADDYAVVYGVTNTGPNIDDNSNPSWAYFDAVPIPGAVWLLGSGLIGLLGLRRKFNG